jgi:APA family basic amino acid/polyamine antiporter
MQRPNEHRPYKAVGYPVLPALYVIAAAGVALTLLLADKTRVQALSGLLIVLLGIPVYFWWHRGRTAHA